MKNWLQCALEPSFCTDPDNSSYILNNTSEISFPDIQAARFLCGCPTRMTESSPKVECLWTSHLHTTDRRRQDKRDEENLHKITVTCQCMSSFLWHIMQFRFYRMTDGWQHFFVCAHKITKLLLSINSRSSRVQCPSKFLTFHCKLSTAYLYSQHQHFPYPTRSVLSCEVLSQHRQMQ